MAVGAGPVGLQERGLPLDTPQESAALAQVMLARFPADEYPHLAEFIFGHVLQPGYDYGDEYEFGLGLILDGLERAHRTAQSPNRTADDKSCSQTQPLHPPARPLSPLTGNQHPPMCSILHAAIPGYLP